MVGFLFTAGQKYARVGLGQGLSLFKSLVGWTNEQGIDGNRIFCKVQTKIVESKDGP